MTTMAALLGAAARDQQRSGRAPARLGITIVGGLIVSQLLTLYGRRRLPLPRPLPALGGATACALLGEDGELGLEEAKP